MEKSIFHATGMTCNHCVQAVTQAVSGLPGVEGDITIDLKAGTVTVMHDKSIIDAEKIKVTIEEEGYTVTG